MKYLKSIHIGAICTLLGLGFFQACNKTESFDIIGDSNTYAYISTSNETPNDVQNEKVFVATQTPIGTFSNVDLKFPVRVNKLTSELTASVGIDNALVQEYNTSHGTDYLSLSESIIELTNTSISIEAGETHSGESVSFRIANTKVAELEPGNYLVPIKLTSVSNNVHISSNLNTVYVKIHVSESLYIGKENVASADMLGSLIGSSDYNTWTYTSSHTSSPISNLWNTRTSNYLSFSADPAIIVFDMKNTKKISGLRVYSRNATTNSPENTFSHVKFSLSTDGTTYTEIADFPREKMNLQSGYQYIGMYGAVEARYIKLELASPMNGLVFMGVYSVQ